MHKQGRPRCDELCKPKKKLSCFCIRLYYNIINMFAAREAYHRSMLHIVVDGKCLLELEIDSFLICYTDKYF